MDLALYSDWLEGRRIGWQSGGGVQDGLSKRGKGRRRVQSTLHCPWISRQLGDGFSGGCHESANLGRPNCCRVSCVMCSDEGNCGGFGAHFRSLQH